MEDRQAARHQMIGNDAAMATPPDGLGTHDGAALAFTAFDQVLQAFAKCVSTGVVGVIVKAVIFPKAIELPGQLLGLRPQTAQGRDVLVRNAAGGQAQR